MVNKIFVYGTLLSGEVRHSLIQELTDGIFTPGIALGELLNFGAWPGMISGDGVVIGELYTLTDVDQALDVLDVIECVSIGLFRREVVDILSDDGVDEAWVYFFNDTDMEKLGKIIESSNWRER